VPDPLDLLDQKVDRLGGPVGDAAGVEVSQRLGPPGVDGARQAGELGEFASAQYASQWYSARAARARSRAW